MIRKLIEADRVPVLEYLYQDVNFNIFPIGDIEAFGFDNLVQVIYGEFDEEGHYLSIFLRYRDNGIYYSHNNHFNVEWLKIFDIERFNNFSGKTELTNLIKPYLKEFTSHQMYFCRANHLNYDGLIDESEIRNLRTEDDCSKLFDLLVNIEEFQIGRQGKEEFIKNKMDSENKMGITLFIKQEDKVVSTVAATAETTKNAMIVGVATDKDYRHKGYATKLLISLMNRYINQKKKELCLFYDNPEAGKIYLRLGFEYIGTWSLYRRQKD